MNKLVTLNPYRLLGIYSNSPTRDKVANMSKLKAFLKVGKSVSFPLDLNGILPSVVRTEETVVSADSKLTLPAERLKHAQFWFMKDGPIDDVAFNHLFAGDMGKAVEIWSKKDSVSSLQNRIVCALINDDYLSACSCAEKLYLQYADSFVTTVAGDTVKGDNLGFEYLDSLVAEVGVSKLLPHITNNNWRQHLNSAAVAPVIESIQAAIDTAKVSRGNGSMARYNAGVKLMNETKSLLTQLNQLLPKSDMQYQMIVDKLANEILQCGIDYFNDSKEDDAAHKAMTLQQFAKSIAIGSMAKQRCYENVGILEKIIKELPPVPVMSEDRAIKEELRKFCNLPDKISHAITLLKNTKPYLRQIREKLGAANDYYLKISTTIVGNALHNVIEEVNDVQKNAIQKFSDPFGLGLSSSYSTREDIKSTLKEAWDAIKLMDGFDLLADFKTNRYQPNRNTLSSLCNQLDIPTSTADKVFKGFESADNATGGCLGNILGYIIFFIIIMIIGAIFSGIGSLFD